jgi:cytochrome c peroxidase
MRSRFNGTRAAALVLCAAVFLTYACGKKAPTSPTPSLQGWPAPTPVSIAPLGFPVMRVPADNPTTVEGVALGRRLYYDPILSGDSTQACASCHRFGRSFSDDKPFSVGIDLIPGTRNAPALVNPGWLPQAFWDGRVASLEDQARQPVADPIEMHSDWDEVVRKLQRHAVYPDMFGRAFGTSVVTQDLVVRAIAQFERMFVSNGSRYDRFLRNEIALSGEEMGGFGLFFTERADCFHCHGNILATDQRFHNVGADPANADPGLGATTGIATDRGKFKTPTLRNVALTGPYFHNARYTTLRQVVEHYNNGVSGVANLDPLIRPAGVGLGMTPGQIDTLLAFLLTLTDSSFVNDTSLASPF